MLALILTAPDHYTASNGFSMQREQGLTPNGNQLAGRWVLRSHDDAMVDFDQYRSDLAARHGFSI